MPPIPATDTALNGHLRNAFADLTSFEDLYLLT